MGGTPTDLMFTPNIDDQKAGIHRCGRRSAPWQIMLCAAVSACATALPQCSSDRNWYPKSACGERATSPATKTSSVTMPRKSKARQPASQAMPRGPAPSPDPVSHSVFRSEPSETTTTSASTTLSSDRWTARTLPTASPSSAVTVTWVRRSTPFSVWRSAATAPTTPPSAPTSGPPARSATVTGRSISRHAEATSEPANPAPMTNTRRGPAFSRRYRSAASSRVRSRHTPSSRASSSFGHGRARTPVAMSSRSYSTSSPSASRTRLAVRSRPVAATPRRHLASISRRCGSSVWCGDALPSSTDFDSGGRSYGS